MELVRQSQVFFIWSHIFQECSWGVNMNSQYKFIFWSNFIEHFVILMNFLFEFAINKQSHYMMSLFIIPSKIKSLRYIYIYITLAFSFPTFSNEMKVGGNGKKSKLKILELLFSPFSSHICLGVLSYHFPLDLFELSQCKNGKERKIYVSSSTFRFNTTKENILRVKKAPYCVSIIWLAYSKWRTPLVKFVFYVGTLLCFVLVSKFHLFHVSRWRISIIPQKFRWE